MDNQPGNDETSTQEIAFPNGQQARLVRLAHTAGAAEALDVLGLERPTPLIVVVGGAARLDRLRNRLFRPHLKPRLEQLLGRGIARAAADAGAAVIDGGTEAGVMALIGQAVADRGRQTVLLGVAPAGRVAYPGGPTAGVPLDANHSHFVLPPGERWGSETETMLALAEALARRSPVVTVLVNGGAIARNEVLHSVRRGWPVVVLSGSGGLADELAALWRRKPSFVADPLLAEVIAEGDIHLFPLRGQAEELRQLIARRLLPPGDVTLQMAWERFALYDSNAVRQQTSFQRLQLWILRLGVCGTALALIQTTARMLGLSETVPWVDRALHYAIVATPITVATLVAAANRFNAGNKWVLLRASAEAIKREIFHYRARAELYSDRQTQAASRQVKLARKVESISRWLMQTEANLSALRPYHGPIPPRQSAAAGDDGLSDLTPAAYIARRLDDQLDFYRRRANALDRRLKRLQWLIYIAGGLGTLLAAVGLELWIALTTTLTTAITTYLAYQQVENTLMRYNQAATDLANVRGWWMALPAHEQTEPRNVDKLVHHTEKVLQGEHVGWVQQMQDALADLRARQEGRAADEDTDSA